MNEEHLIYAKYGNGSKILFAFHGFGQDKNYFKSWEEKLSRRYTVYAFDLFYHGQSIRPLKSLSKMEWEKHFEKILISENIESFSLLGYSLGGRFAISSALSFPDRTEEIILIAPDGIFPTIWFKLATTPVIRQVFKYLMLNPDKLEKWMRFNKKIKIVNKYVADFVRKEMGNAENRRRVYISWNYFKSLGYNRKQLIREFRKHSFKRRLILGELDHIIRPEDVLPITNAMTGFDVEVLAKKHHQLMDLDVADIIMRDP